MTNPWPTHHPPPTHPQLLSITTLHHPSQTHHHSLPSHGQPITHPQPIPNPSPTHHHSLLPMISPWPTHQSIPNPSPTHCYQSQLSTAHHKPITTHCVPMANLSPIPPHPQPTAGPSPPILNGDHVWLLVTLSHSWILFGGRGDGVCVCSAGAALPAPGALHAPSPQPAVWKPYIINNSRGRTAACSGPALIPGLSHLYFMSASQQAQLYGKKRETVSSGSALPSLASRLSACLFLPQPLH